MVKRYYRISRRQKKKEKKNILKLTNQDLKAAGEKLEKMKNLKYSRWFMAGVLYHRYNFL